MKNPLTPRSRLAFALYDAVLAMPLAIVGCGGGNNNGPLNPTTGGATTAGTTTAGTTTAGTTTAGTTTAGTTTAGTTTAGTTTAGTTTAGTTTAGTTTAGTTTAGTTTAGSTTAGTTTGSSVCNNEPANLTYSNITANYNGSRVNTTCGSGFSSRLPGSTNGVTSVISLFGDIVPGQRAERRYSVLINSPTPITVGAQFNIAAPPTGTQISVNYLERNTNSSDFISWRATSGIITVQNVAGPFTINLSNGNFNNETGGAAGSFTLNGTVAFNKQF